MTNTEDVTTAAYGVSIADLIIAGRKKCILSAKNCREFFALVIPTTEVEKSLMKIKKVGRVRYIEISPDTVGEIEINE